MNTQILPISREGWTKVDGVQPVKDDILVELLWGIASLNNSVGVQHTCVYAKEVNWNGRTIESPDYWRRVDPYTI